MARAGNLWRVIFGAGLGASLMMACSPSSGQDGAEEGASETAAKAGGLDMTEETPAYSFSFSSPAEASAIPALHALMHARADKAKAALDKDSAQAKAEADKAGYPFNPYGYGEDWSVVADLPGWLSLSATIWSYTGGAHGMTVFDALVWDKAKGAAMAPLDLFASQSALSAAVRSDYCAAIDVQRAEKREIPVSEVAQDGMFGQCIDIDSATLVLGSEKGAGFDQIGFLIPPYEAGPYAEGVYEVSLPVNAAILGAVKPEYRAAFAAVR